jgi:hypothetical protein
LKNQDNNYDLEAKTIILSGGPAGFVFCFPWVIEGPAPPRKQILPVACLNR